MRENKLDSHGEYPNPNQRRPPKLKKKKRNSKKKRQYFIKSKCWPDFLSPSLFFSGCWPPDEGNHTANSDSTWYVVPCLSWCRHPPSPPPTPCAPVGNITHPVAYGFAGGNFLPAQKNTAGRVLGHVRKRTRHNERTISSGWGSRQIGKRKNKRTSQIKKNSEEL